MIPAAVIDYRRLAERRLPRRLFDYIDGGSYGEVTLGRNVADFAALTLRQRVLRDVTDINLATTLFGQSLSMPLLLAPVGMAGMYARRGEVQAARAARDAGVPFCLSTVGICGIEEVAQAGAPPWFQLYAIKDRGYMAALLERAETAGCPVLVLTVDLPRPGSRYRDLRSGMSGNPGKGAWMRAAFDGLRHPRWLYDVWLRGRPHGFANLAAAMPDARSTPEFWAWVGANFDASLTWADLDWIRARWSRPIVIKGVLDVEDARAAVAVGADGIVVSNHGGRQLDGVASTIAVLPAIADAVDGAAKILIDGGVRSGLDIVKAIASGADACLFGRPWAWALGARGEQGVRHVLDIVRQEMILAMTLVGQTDVAQLDRTALD